ncbi:hypothetical protein TGPRC2_241840C, partial [Toxoplasma gondii TgCatPRC2]
SWREEIPTTRHDVRERKRQSVWLGV